VARTSEFSTSSSLEVETSNLASKINEIDQPKRKMEAKKTQLIHTWDLLQAAGKQHSVIRVRNLQTSLIVGTDAWGRKGKNQPVLISASASLRNPFESASSEDAVTGSTIHYGIMSKAILGACKLFSLNTSNLLSDLVDIIHSGLIKDVFTTTGGSSQHAAAAASSTMSLLEIKVLLPKASLLGSGVSLTKYLMFDPAHEAAVSESWILNLHDLKIPTLIGVNPNERLAKQLVVATVKIDGIQGGLAAHLYSALELIVVKVRKTTDDCFK
jgi:dihydroneopterin aldolase